MLKFFRSLFPEDTFFQEHAAINARNPGNTRKSSAQINRRIKENDAAKEKQRLKHLELRNFVDCP